MGDSIRWLSFLGGVDSEQVVLGPLPKLRRRVLASPMDANTVARRATNSAPRTAWGASALRIDERASSGHS
jgi:hypothetical protein